MDNGAGPGQAIRRNAALDGLRGYAALAVLFHHTILAPNPHLVEDVLRQGVGVQDTTRGVLTKTALALLNGEAAVAAFFVISGIVLFRALGAAHGPAVGGGGPSGMLATSWRFALRRTLRIWPVMAACLVAKTVLSQHLDATWPGLVHAPTGEDLVANLVLARYPVHGATWTLFVELAAVPAFLLCFFAVWSFGTWALLLVGFGLCSAVALLRQQGLLAQHGGELLGGLPFLVAGMAIECGCLLPLKRSPLWRPAVVLALVPLFACTLVLPIEGTKFGTGALLLSIPLLVGYVHHAGSGGWAGRILLAAPSRYLGRISFSFYLWNVPVFELLLAPVPSELARAYPLETGLLLGLAAFAASVPVAHLSERWLERPCIRLGRAVTGGGSAGRRGRPWKPSAEPGKVALHASPD